MWLSQHCSATRFRSAVTIRDRKDHARTFAELFQRSRQAGTKFILFACGGLALNVACVRDTAVPWSSLAISTTASSCFANAWIRLVPSPPLLSLAFTSGLPMPLSEIVSFQSVSATLYETTIAAPGFKAGKACF